MADEGEPRMKKLLSSLTLALALMSSAAAAQERAADAAIGAVSGAVVLGPVGAIAGALVGYAAGPSIARAWGLHRSSRPRQARRPATAPATSVGEAQPTPRNRTDAPTTLAASPAPPAQIVAPPSPSPGATAAMPPVQPLE